jgi:hypothetical protein
MNGQVNMLKTNIFKCTFLLTFNKSRGINIHTGIWMSGLQIETKFNVYTEKLLITDFGLYLNFEKFLFCS